MFLVSNNEIVLYVLILTCVVPILVLIGVALFKMIQKSKKENKKRKKEILEGDVDSEQLKMFVEAYGGVENIVSINIEKNRLIVKVIDVDVVLSEQLVKLGAANVLFQEKLVKASFGDRAVYVYKLLSNYTEIDSKKECDCGCQNKHE